MPPLAIYSLCLLGAIGLLMAMRPGDGSRRAKGMRGLGALLGLGFVIFISVQLAASTIGGPGPFVAMFGLVSVISAAQMITSAKPVYSALHFVLVVIAGAGLFLMLGAEFMAFSLIIVYAGAILITYMFVLMLAQQSPSAAEEDGEAEYDRFAREPVAGAVVAFVLLALLTNTLFDGTKDARPRLTAAEAMVESWSRLHGMPLRIAEAAEDTDASAVLDRADDGSITMDLRFTVMAELDGSRTAGDLDAIAGPGVTIEQVASPVETPDGFASTRVTMEIGATDAGIDVAGLLAEPRRLEPSIRGVLGPRGLAVLSGPGTLVVTHVDAAVAANTDDGAEMIPLAGSARPNNIQDVGLALITDFPASLEVAGVILLMAMFGAVILARRQIEIGEDEKRTAAGLRPLGDYDEADEASGDSAAGEPA